MSFPRANPNSRGGSATPALAARMSGSLRLLQRAGGQVFGHVIAEPVRSGRLRAIDWPPGLQAVVVVGGGLSLIMVLLAGLSGILRRHTELLFRPPNLSLPAITLPLIAVPMIFAVAVLYVAALHVRLVVKVPILLVTCSIVLNPASREDFRLATLPILVAAAALLVFAVLRWRRPFRTFELPVALLLVAAPLCYGIGLISQRYGLATPSIGWNTFLPVTHMLAILAGPFAALAGATITELLASTCIAVAQAGGDLVRRVSHARWILLGALVVLIIGRAVQITVSLTSGEERAASLLLGALPLLIPLLVLGLARQRRYSLTPFRPLTASTILTDWTRWALLAAALVAVVATGRTLIVNLLVSFGLDQPAEWLNTIGIRLSVEVTGGLTVLILLAVTLVVYRRTGRLSLLLVLLAALILLRMIYSLTGVAGSFDGTVILATLASAAIVVVLVLRRELTADRAITLGSVLLLCGLYDYRQEITEPLTALLALAGGAIGLMVGAIWRLLTDNTFALGDSAGFPRPARVLIIVANGVFGSSTIALLALQGGVSESDMRLMENLGDSQLGFSLVVAVLLVQLYSAIVGAEDPAPPSDDDQSSQPFSVATRTASARDTAPSLPIADDKWLRTVPSER